ncbi:MAG TPA: hypothetical protein VIN10_02415 [Bacteroidales bacterium]
MKKIFLLSASLILCFNLHILAQTDTDDVIFNADLQNVFAITVTSGNTQNAVFDTPAEYNLGINAVGTSVFQVESTDDWYCDLNANGVNFNPVTGSGNLPVDNIGYWLEAIGSNTFGAELVLTQSNSSLATSKSVTAVPVRIIDLGSSSNAGGQAENEFNLNWTMGTMQGDMHATSMMDQIANGDFTLGTYTTTITLTATQIP